jgi:kumamolisin
VPARQAVTFDLVLAQPGGARARAALAAIENLASPSFRDVIPPGRYGRRFGLSDRALARTEGWLHRAGIQVVASYPQRTVLTVRAAAGTVRDVFGAGLVRYRDAAGHRFRLARGAVVIPPPLRATVLAVTGLDTRQALVAHDVPITGLDPAEAALAYDIAPLHRAGYDGQGQTIAIVAFSSFDPSDPASYAREHGITGPPPSVVSVDHGTTDSSEEIETNLDIDVIRAVAPAARVLVYEADETSSSYADVINAIVRQRQATIISSSWGQCEPELKRGERLAEASALRAAVAAGVTMFVASGDQGAYDCQQSDFGDRSLSVDWPGSSTDAVSVGGTRLLLGPGFRYAGESAWVDQLYAEGSGGGISRFDSRPSWQADPGVLGRWSNGHRQVPDVAAAADPGTPWAIYTDGGDATESGTSASAPFWAAATALVAQYAARHRVGRLGYVNPLLYAIARRHWALPPFHDVTRGSNRFYRAGPGWDPATGLGSPDVFDLARDVVSFLRGGRR